MNFAIIFTFVLILYEVNDVNAEENICSSEACRKLSYDIKKSMNNSVNPCDDFSQYICGNYSKKHKIEPGKDYEDIFSAMNKNAVLILQKLLDKQKMDNPDLLQTKAAIFYQSCIDQKQKDKISDTQILDISNEIDPRVGLSKNLATLLEHGITSRIININIAPDLKNPLIYTLKIDKPDTILPLTIRQFPHKRFMEISMNYEALVENVLKWLEAPTQTLRSLKYFHWIRIAGIYSILAARVMKNEKPVSTTIRKLRIDCPAIDWKDLLNRVLNTVGKNISDDDNIILFSRKYLKFVCIYIANVDYIHVINDLKWADISELINFGSSELQKYQEEYTHKTFGGKTKRSIRKICANLVSDKLGDIASNMLVKNSFNDSKRNDVREILNQMKKSLHNTIQNNTWKDDVAKGKALQKLQWMKGMIGYNDWILDEHQLDENHKELRFNQTNFIGNYYKISKINFMRKIKLFKEKVADHKNRQSLLPVNVEVAYDTTTNTLSLPAALLQNPLYDDKYPLSIKFGGLGAIISLVIMNGFNVTEEVQYEKGERKMWWLDQETQKFSEAVSCIKSKNEKTKRTSSESLSELEASKVAYKAMKIASGNHSTLPGLNFTHEQLFFVQRAWTWCINIKKKAQLSDWFNEWKYRINEPSKNMLEFHEAFNCPAQNRNSKRCSLN